MTNPLRHILCATCASMLLLGQAAVANELDILFEGRQNNPDNLSGLSAFTSKAVNDGEYDQAVSTLEDYLVRFPRDAQARLSAAKIYANLGSWDLVKRHANVALETGDLDQADTNEANGLLTRADKGISGFEWDAGFTLGFGFSVLDVQNNLLVGPFRDRTDFTPFASVDGTVRISLDSPLDDAVVISGRFDFERRFEDVFLGAPFVGGIPAGRVFNSPNAFASITYDKGLPVTFIDAARLQIGTFIDFKTFNPNIDEIAIGGKARLVLQTSTDTSFYLESGYATLQPSNNLPVDGRVDYGIGYNQRISANHSFALALKGGVEFLNGSSFSSDHGLELAYANRLPFKPFGWAWTQEVVTGASIFQTDNFIPFFSGLSGIRAFGGWNHQLHIDGKNRINFGYNVTSINFDQPLVASTNSFNHRFTVSYTKRF